MKKLFYVAAVAALALASCKSGNNNNAEGNTTEQTTQDAAAQQAAADDQALASAQSFQGWIESINGQNYVIRNAEGQTLTVTIPNPGEELIEGEPIIIKYIAADGANKAATDNAKSVDLSLASNFKKLLGKWGTPNNEVTFELRKSGKCKNVGKGQQNTEFLSWNLKDEKTITFTVASKGVDPFPMDWEVESLDDNNLTLKNGESKFPMTRIDSNRE